MPDNVTRDESGFPLSETVESDREFDQELGKQMGADAQEVANGNMTEDEFFEKYRDEVEEEFGENAQLLGREVNDE